MKFKRKYLKEINKNRLILLLVGFCLLEIPLLLFCYGFEKYYSFLQEKTKQTLKQHIFQQIKQIKNNIEPNNYLENEFSKIHSKLIPDYPDKNINGLPDNEYISKIYSKDLLNRLISLIKDKYNPIIITLGTNNIEKVYSYFSSDLLKQLGNDKKYFLYAKNYNDFLFLLDKYNNNYNNEKNLIISHYIKYLSEVDEIKPRGYYDELCNKYLSRFQNYRSNNASIYSDYFNKQIIYPITNYTLSMKGIHGFYSAIIPQSHIDPSSIIKSVITNKESLKIDLVDNKSISNLKETKTGIEYRLNFPTVFLTQIKAFKRLRGIDRSYLLNKQLKISMDYPKDLLELEKTNKLIKVLPYISFPFFY